MIEVEIGMFGAFRKYERGLTPMSLELEEPATVGNIKAALGKRLHELFPALDQNVEQLIRDSAIANEREVLSPDAVVCASCTLSVLPPVCGG